MATTEAIPHFKALTGFSPFPWQERCYQQLCRGEIPDELVLPTGSGKTSIVLLYLLALAAGANLPRRLAYVVDRRAIVDQTTAELERWVEGLEQIPEVHDALSARAAFGGLGSSPIALGTLRGGVVDSGEWRLDPAKPAVLVGTVDIIGSRLLFSGYGDGRSRRSLHAGLLGIDTTVILDESHLSPAFSGTLGEVQRLHRSELGFGFRTLTMSATPRESAASTLQEADEAHPVLGARLQAGKYLTLHRTDKTPEWRDRMVELALSHDRGTVLLFSRSAQEAQKLYNALVKALAEEGGADRVGLLTGTLRGAEREELTQRALWKHFGEPEGHPPAGGPVILVATAAGEVGVDLDADHMVMDLAPMDSTVQRLGRLNRSGRNSSSTVSIVYTDQDVTFKEGKTDWKHRFAAACSRTLSLLENLSCLAPRDVLSGSIEEFREASSPAPQQVPLETARINLLAATSAKLDLPPIAPFLRGITEEPETADTYLLWRSDLETLLQRGISAAQEALAMLPPRPRELLKVPAYVAAKELSQLARATGPFPCVSMAADGTVSELEITEGRTDLQRLLRHGTLVLPARVGGLSEAGFLEPRRAGYPASDLADDEEAIRFEQRSDQLPPDVPAWASESVQWWAPLHDEDDEEAEPRWWVYARRRPGELALISDSDLSRLARQIEYLAPHNRRVGEAAGRLGRTLGLPGWIVDALQEAGGRHDDGKASRLWQRAAGNRSDEPVAKSPRARFRPGVLGGYRHEFGSLGQAERDLPVGEGEPDLQRDLALHLIAAHHGHARPGFPERKQWGTELPDRQAEHLAQEAERRYARLFEYFGPWGLAWVEALLKCADGWVSSGYAYAEGPHG